MMRVVALLLALIAITLPAAHAAPARDWSQAVAVSPAGIYTIGIPKAPVHLTEYLSYDCIHCGHFAADSDTALTAMIRSGSTSLELRPIALNRLSMAATMLARCAGPKRFAATHHAIFARQDQWLNRGFVYMQTTANRYALNPIPDQLKLAADTSGLSDVARASGFSDGAIAACFANQAELKRVATLTASAADISGTPTFLVNGKKYENMNWATLQPVLRAAGAR